MIELKSKRSQDKLNAPRFFGVNREGMRTFNGPASLLIGFDLESGNVKNLSIQGGLEPWLQVSLEAWGEMVEGKALERMDQVTLKEAEAFLRDRNSELSIEGLTASEEILFKSIISWAKTHVPQKNVSNYLFSSTLGPFRGLKLSEKVREMKNFLSSVEVFSLYGALRLPELVDVDGMTIYIDAPYSSEGERAIFDKLHMLGVSVFKDEDLNFIPEG